MFKIFRTSTVPVKSIIEFTYIVALTASSTIYCALWEQ